MKPDALPLSPGLRWQVLPVAFIGRPTPGPGHARASPVLYTMPLANHRDDEHGEEVRPEFPLHCHSPPRRSSNSHVSFFLLSTLLHRSLFRIPTRHFAPQCLSPGVASMVSVHVEHPQEASVVVHQVERLCPALGRGGCRGSGAAEAAARSERLGALHSVGTGRAACPGRLLGRLRPVTAAPGGCAVASERRPVGEGPRPATAGAAHLTLPTVCVPAARAPDAGGVPSRGRLGLGRSATVSRARSSWVSPGCPQGRAEED